MDTDYEFADWIFSYGGCITFSTAYQEENQIRIVSGPLKDLEGRSTCVDRRGHCGQVMVKIRERETKVWLGFDLLETPLSVKGEVFV